MIADVYDEDKVFRITLPKPIAVDDRFARAVYIGRRTARMVIKSHVGLFYFALPAEYERLSKIKAVRDAIDAVREPRPL